jgi:hypothetical protein
MLFYTVGYSILEINKKSNVKSPTDLSLKIFKTKSIENQKSLRQS